MRKLIGINGLIGTGKDTTADYLVKHHNFTKLSFAAKLKDIIAYAFDLDRDMIDGTTPESRKKREEPIEFWSNELGRDVSARYLLQVIGTDCFRNGFSDNVWVSFVKKKIIENPKTNFVITDVRFPNEGAMVTELGGEVWHVKRGHYPNWWETAVNHNINLWEMGMTKDMISPGHFLASIHASERCMAGYNFDKIISNDSTFNDLYNQIDNSI